jgi:elongation factor P
MATTADIRNGLVIEFNHDLYQITEFQHVKPGKGAAFVRTRLKSMTSGKVLDHTFSSGEKLETARVIGKKMQFLYAEDGIYNFMDNETFEQTTIDANLLENTDLLLEGMEVEIFYHEETDKAIRAELPQYIILEITYCEPGLKGDTATNASKRATVETGAEINVPLFVNTGDKIKIDTAKRAYVERAK